MKKLLVILFLLSSISSFSKDRVIENPTFSFKMSGIDNVIKIELNKNETRLTMHATFIPRWWVKFPTETFIQDAETGEKFFVTNIINGELDKEIYMPASGDSTFILIFPPLDKKVKKIHYGEVEDIYIYDLELQKSKKKKDNEVPPYVYSWLNEQLEKTKGNKTIDYHSEDFFKTGTAHIVGFIKGYDPRMNFSTGIIYATNIITNEDFPIVVSVHKDGRFEAQLPVNHPQTSSIVFEAPNRTWIKFYIEQDQTLAMILDWDEFIQTDRFRNGTYNFKNTIYLGPLADVNYDLQEFQIPTLDYREYQRLVANMSVEQIKNHFDKSLEKNLKQIQELKTKFKSEKTFDILCSMQYSNIGYWIMEYDAQPVDKSFYNLLHKIPLNSPVLLLDSPRSFINRYEFSDIFRESYSVYQISKPTKNFFEYLIEDEKLNLTKDELELKNILDTLEGTIKTSENQKYIDDIVERRDDFNQKYKDYYSQYSEKYISHIVDLPYIEKKVKAWTIKDSLLSAYLNLEPNMLHDISKIRSIEFEITGENKDEARYYLDYVLKNVTNSYFLQEAERIFKKTFSTKEKTYKLPEGKGTDIFNKIIEPFKGKLIMVDFWATTCGPCIGGITASKEFRKELVNNSDIEIVFITCEKESPLPSYEKFVAEQELINSYRLKGSEYHYLRELFKFNGIPKYVLIDSNGDVLNDNFHGWWELENDIEKYLDN